MGNAAAAVAATLAGVGALALLRGGGRSLVLPGGRNVGGPPARDLSQIEHDPAALVDVSGLAASVASQLRSGQAVSIAWQRSLVSVPILEQARAGQGGLRFPFLTKRHRRIDQVKICEETARAMEGGAAPSVALDMMAQRIREDRDCELRTGMQSLAAASRLAEATGAPLADVLDSVAFSLDERRESDAARAAALAGPQATTRLLGWLPVVGIGLGQVMGAEPLKVLMDGGVGTAAGLIGVALMVVGRRWSAAMVRGVIGDNE